MRVCPSALFLAFGIVTCGLETSCPAGGLFEQGEFVCFEAEAAGKTEKPMELKAESGASDGKCLHIPEKIGKPPEVLGKAVFKFKVTKPGIYYLWARTWWLDGCGDSMSVTMNKELKLDLTGSHTLMDSTHKHWHWVRLGNRKPVKFRLRKGEHTLEIGNREDGTKLDQVLLTTDAEYVPVAIEEVTGHLVTGTSK